MASDAKMSVTDFETWLAAYGRAWEDRDADAAAALFGADARYYETPYSEPFSGPDGVRDYWARVTADQRDVSFESAPIAVQGSVGIASWRATFSVHSTGARVELNGVFVLEFDGDGRCALLREWWHVR